MRWNEAAVQWLARMPPPPPHTHLRVADVVDEEDGDFVPVRQRRRQRVQGGLEQCKAAGRQGMPSDLSSRAGRAGRAGRAEPTKACSLSARHAARKRGEFALWRHARLVSTLLCKLMPPAPFTCLCEGDMLEARSKGLCKTATDNHWVTRSGDSLCVGCRELSNCQAVWRTRLRGTQAKLVW